MVNNWSLFTLFGLSFLFIYLFLGDKKHVIHIVLYYINQLALKSIQKKKKLALKWGYLSFFSSFDFVDGPAEDLYGIFINRVRRERPPEFLDKVRGWVMPTFLCWNFVSEPV